MKCPKGAYHTTMRIQQTRPVSLANSVPVAPSGYLIRVKSKRARTLFYDETDYIVFHALLRQHIRLLRYPGLVAYSIQGHQYDLLFQGSDGQRLIKALNVSYTAYHFRRHNQSGTLFYDVYKSTNIRCSSLLLSTSLSFHHDQAAHWLYSSVGYYQARYLPDWLEISAHCRLAGGHTKYCALLRAQKNRPGGAILRRSMRS